MVKNNWIDFVKEYRKKHPGMKYGDVLRKAAKSAEWVKYKEKHGNKKTTKKSPKKKVSKTKKGDKKCECDENKYVSELIEDDEEMLQMIRKLMRENKKLKKELKKNEK